MLRRQTHSDMTRNRWADPSNGVGAVRTGAPREPQKGRVAVVLKRPAVRVRHGRSVPAALADKAAVAGNMSGTMNFRQYRLFPSRARARCSDQA